MKCVAVERTPSIVDRSWATNCATSCSDAPLTNTRRSYAPLIRKHASTCGKRAMRCAIFANPVSFAGVMRSSITAVTLSCFFFMSSPFPYFSKNAA